MKAIEISHDRQRVKEIAGVAFGALSFGALTGMIAAALPGIDHGQATAIGVALGAIGGAFVGLSVADRISADAFQSPSTPRPHVGARSPDETI